MFRSLIVAASFLLSSQAFAVFQSGDLVVRERGTSGLSEADATNNVKNVCEQDHLVLENRAEFVRLESVVFTDMQPGIFAMGKCVLRVK